MIVLKSRWRSILSRTLFLILRSCRFLVQHCMIPSKNVWLSTLARFTAHLNTSSMSWSTAGAVEMALGSLAESVDCRRVAIDWKRSALTVFWYLGDCSNALDFLEAVSTGIYLMTSMVKAKALYELMKMRQRRSRPSLKPPTSPSRSQTLYLSRCMMTLWLPSASMILKFRISAK